MDPGHGGFLGYVPDAAADLARVGPEQQRLAAVAGFTEHEQRLLRWFRARPRVSATAGGYLTSGGSAANHDALAVRTRPPRRLGRAA